MSINWNLIVNDDADMLDFGDCERGTAAVHRLHGSIIFTKISSPSWLGLVQCHKSWRWWFISSALSLNLYHDLLRSQLSFFNCFYLT